MLTKVYLEGPLGKQFGREWELAANTPNEALRLINANVGNLFLWIKKNLPIYARYRVVIKKRGARHEALDTNSYPLAHDIESIRFIPVIAGAGGLVKMVIGIALITYGVVTGNYAAMRMGFSMVISGIIEALMTPNTGRKKDNSGATTNSHFFDGPVNTEGQGRAVPLIYGRVLVGSQVISAKLSIDEIPV
jgi:predicted phage tail protein